MKTCPICGHAVEAYHEVTFKQPFIHNNPYDGLTIYGAYSAPKETLCHENNFLHFAFYDSNGNLVDHRLVQLGVEQPATPSPSEDLADEEEDYDWTRADEGWDMDEDNGSPF